MHFITLAILIFQVHLTLAIPTISSVGAKFFTSEGQQWFIKGVAYQLTEGDTLVDTNQCKQDVELMKTLGVNAIRVYHIDPKEDHTGCMSALSDAGIYLFVDLDSAVDNNGHPAGASINPDNLEWNKTQYDAYQAVFDEFQKFDNTAGVLVGNEVLNQPAHAKAAPFVLATARDMKQYRDQKGYRKIPVGYSAADIAQLRPMLQNYFACRAEPDERMDFFSLNSYEWCGPATYTSSGYSKLQEMASTYSIPIFFSETGCNVDPPRLFTDQAAIFGSDMVNNWSGSIIYEWSQAGNKYGLVTYGDPSSSGYKSSGSPVPIKPDFANLQSQWANLSPKGVAKSAYDTASIKPPTCPSQAPTWDVDPSAPLPTIGQKGEFTADPTATSRSTAHSTSSGTGTATGASTGTGTATPTESLTHSGGPPASTSTPGSHKSGGAIPMVSVLELGLSSTGVGLLAIGFVFFWL